MKKIGIIGHFGFGFEYYDGQTVKTRMVAEELERQLGKENVNCCDTHGGIKIIHKILLSCFKCLRKYKNVIAMPDSNGVKVIFPWLVMLNCIFRRKIHYVVIGGWLSEFLKKRRFLRAVLKKLDGVYVETTSMKTALEAQGFENVFVMPNCKNIEILREEDLIYPDGEPYKLCIFSRVMKEKGVEDAVNAVKAVNERFGRTVYSLDIYGPVDSEQTEWFDNLKIGFPDYVKYCGIVPYDKSVEVLKNYFALLFPTYYEGEGFAGTLIDALSSGIPVIATDWKYNAEIVSDGVGYIYKTGDQNAFVDILKSAAIDASELLSKKRQCLVEARKYNISEAVNILIGRLYFGS